MPDITMLQQSTKSKKRKSTESVEDTEKSPTMTPEQVTPKRKSKKTENKKTKLVENHDVDNTNMDTTEAVVKKDKKDKPKKDKTSKMNGDVPVKNKEKKVKINGDLSLKTKEKKVKVKKRNKKENGNVDIDESVVIGLTSDMDTSQNDSAIDLSHGSKRNGDSDGSDEENEKSEDQIHGAFENFPLAASTVEKLKAKGISYLFPVQYKTFTTIHEGNDLIVQARTGTGKTMAFALPLIERLQESPSQDKPPKVLVLTPTRELATQVCGDFESVSSQKLRMVCIYGGVPYYPQEKAIRRGLDVVVGTPGRILDIIDKGWLDLSQLRHVILDEVDRMLDMGFVDDVESIIRSAYENEANNKPQTLLFSATLPVWVDKTASKYMTDSVQRIDLVGQQSIRTALSVTHLAIECSWDQRASVIADIITVYSGAHGRAMVFCEMKKDADALGSNDNMKLERHVLHGDITQSRREFVLNDFKAGKCKVLITTDVAARGLDIPSVDVVIQCTPPKDIDSYIHRSGRTGRANRKGISVLLYQPFESQALHYVERKSGILFDRVPAPQFSEIVEAIGADARQSLQKVAPETVDNFRHQAHLLLKEMDPEDALAAALSVISGCATISPRSLMGNLKEHTSWELRSTGQEIYSKAFVFSTLTRSFPDFDTSLIRDIRHTMDRMAFVFDVANSLNKLLRENWVENKFNTLTELTSLPSLQAPMARRNNGGGSRFGGRGGGGRGDFRRRGGGGRDGGGGRRGGGGGGDRRGGGRGDNQYRYLKRSNRQSDGGGSQNKRGRFN